MDILWESFGAFAAYLGASIGLTAIFVLIYMQITPHDEIKLIRAGNGAAALGLSGALIGFVLPLSTVISVSQSLTEAMIWGGVALLVQIAGHALSRLLLPRISADIADGKYAAAIVQAAIGVSFGMLQSACWIP